MVVVVGRMPRGGPGVAWERLPNKNAMASCNTHLTEVRYPPGSNDIEKKLVRSLAKVWVIEFQF